jgi:undecaprenyl diphosphate synthase
MAAPTAEEIARNREAVGIPDDRFPSSVAIIMDGNGRWAKQRGEPRTMGHIVGAQTAMDIITDSANLGLDCLTLYGFSMQNWKRPGDEVDSIMDLYVEYLAAERETLMENNVRLQHIGSREDLPGPVMDELDKSVEISSKNTGMRFCLALNYGSREEIIDATRSIARRVKDGNLSIEDIDQQVFSDSLTTAGAPDPDLLIRTAGEMRVSNFLLYQISYAEIYVTDTFWPDFREEEFHKALRAYADRDRRFGGLGPASSQ